MKALLLSDADGFRRVLQSVVQEFLEAEMAEALELQKANGTRSGSATGPVTPDAGL
ncbi:hypothetical protein [Mesorhizobium japonicum]|uniref:Msr5991 protein n=1 Tax=Mesorhizobium japonicum (strain LMG 29417 / CECT 9101 / MAFF 303099) TaxID=266835 RepID=Q98AI0_RHILO|nr:hypothetical protein [Mesorhizobium japonicum]BAB52350.1 msr5991 [Mesorhizobium japonicum MAFF 303099]